MAKAKAKTAFVCAKCGYETGKWMGRCPSCGEWGSLEETVLLPEPSAAKPKRSDSGPVLIADVSADDAPRFSSGIGELNRVLGGGLVPGSLVLLGGDPGIGKSTILLQACMHLSAEKKVLYVSGEESAAQIRMRADRLGRRFSDLHLYAQTDMELIEAAIEKMRPGLVVVDSVQTMSAPPYQTAPGSVSQVRECASRLLRVAKENNITVFLVGHVTKEGAIAGPRLLEHMVDTVLYFEGERREQYRVLRAVKNRFGSTNEIGLFQMTGEGMLEVENPSAALLSSRLPQEAGSAVTCVIEGTRPVLVEIQALVSSSPFGNPRRMATGADYNRMVLLIAVLEKRAGLPLYNQDAYVNVVGGLKLDETASDLAIVAALCSSFCSVPLQERAAYLGEVGLTGEIRPVPQIERRIAECAQLGFTKIHLPAQQVGAARAPAGTQIIGVSRVGELLRMIRPEKPAPAREGE